ncbi:hypothetical protein BC830DRAFT_1061736 [Chytriomyces sp. MP71]|nr:hypothetical protein BC830DRAFT_1061736 [Chytriomyces sp. MP71]
MILMDVSGSMLWDPRNGVIGPDGIRRFHNQPANLELVRHLMHRCLNHMVPRAQREHAKQYGIPTVTFSSRATFVGQMSASQFDHDWHNKIRPNLGGGTQVMMGWQKVKNTYFEQVHKATGHGFFHNIFGWQPTPGMPKLSLLVFLDGEAMDMDEFELELMGESWAFVTICLVGYENCPHHHSHAMELERVARYNPHVGFYDVQGRALERYAVEQVLKSVYPVDPPTYQEIVDPRFEIYN